MKSRKGCWTCAGRKIQCDGSRPTCERCARSRITCQGYESRLSWPKDNDKRRAILQSVTPQHVKTSDDPSYIPNNVFFINTAWHDMELHRHLTSQTQNYHASPSLSNLLKPPQLYEGQNDLFQYFHEQAHLSLVTFSVATWQIRDALMSMTAGNETSTGLALLHALLAYSSLHRNGLNEQAAQFKIQALQFLSASVQDGTMSSAKAAQHVAASMLLGSFETLHPSESSGEWLWHTWGALDVIHATQDNGQPSQSHTHYLLDWVYYHDTLSRFSTHHWRHKSLAHKTRVTNREPSPTTPYSSLTRYRPKLPLPNPSYAILSLLSEACDTLVDPRDPRSRSPEYLESLRSLQSRIDNTSIVPSTANTTPEGAVAMKLYQAATRIYIARASQSPWEAAEKLDSLIDDVFQGPGAVCVSCEHFFPLLILACEARRDDQRVAILNLIERTQRDTRIRSIKGVTDAIQAIWVQQDLHADSDVLVNYFDLLSAGISSGSTIPSFA